MPKLALTDDFDYTVGGGRILGGSPNVGSEGRAIAKVGDRVEPHGEDEHKNAVIIEGSPTVTVNNLPVAREGDLASCGHVIVVTATVGTVEID